MPEDGRWRRCYGIEDGVGWVCREIVGARGRGVGGRKRQAGPKGGTPSPLARGRDGRCRRLGGGTVRTTGVSNSGKGVLWVGEDSLLDGRRAWPLNCPTISDNSTGQGALRTCAIHLSRRPTRPIAFTRAPYRVSGHAHSARSCSFGDGRGHAALPRFSPSGHALDISRSSASAWCRSRDPSRNLQTTASANAEDI